MSLSHLTSQAVVRYMDPLSVSASLVPEFLVVCLRCLFMLSKSISDIAKFDIMLMGNNARIASSIIRITQPLTYRIMCSGNLPADSIISTRDLWNTFALASIVEQRRSNAPRIGIRIFKQRDRCHLSELAHCMEFG